MVTGRPVACPGSAAARDHVRTPGRRGALPTAIGRILRQTEEGITGHVAIVTDSTADLAPGVAAAAAVRVVPLSVRFGADEFQAGVDLSTEQFWERLLAPGAPLPATAAPSPGTFREAFMACFDEGAGAIVCPTIGSRLSATFQSATLAAQALPDREIHVVDTGSTSMATGIPALIAAEMAAAGVPAAEIAAAIRDRLPSIDLYVATDTLEYLRRNGRLSAARARIGTVLSIKPIITVRDGIVVMAESARTRTKARARVIELVTAQPIERLAILHTPTSTREEVEGFRDSLLARAQGDIDPSAISIGLIGASTGPHLGPGLMGAVFVARG
jgi:DegV family protein with EDD domain